MKYITSVKDGDLVKHIVEVNGENLEITEGKHPYSSDIQYRFNKVYMGVKTLDITAESRCLSEIVLAAEIFRFIKSQL